MFAYLMAWMQLSTDRRAVTALEYGLIAAAMAAVVVGGMAVVGPALTGVFHTISTEL
jgi:pilus assembly protein Flp/PilA